MTFVAGRVCRQDGCDGERPENMPWEQAFEEAWPAVERRLRDILRARNVPAADQEDYLQEVAARALTAQVEFHCAADLLPWASTVVRRLHIGSIRRSARLRQAANVNRLRHVPDAASAVVAKLDLDRVAETLASWSTTDRDMVLGGRGAGAVDATDAGGFTADNGAAYARRYRLRAKLLAAIDGLAGVVGGWRRFQQVNAPQFGQVAAAIAAPAAIACAVLVAPWIGGALHDGDDRGPGGAGSASPDHAGRWSPTLASVDTGAAPSSVLGGGGAPSFDSSNGSRKPGDGPSRKPPSYQQVHSPVEQRVEVGSGNQKSSIEVENTDDETGEYCFWAPGIVDETCVEQPGGALVVPLPG